MRAFVRKDRLRRSLAASAGQKAANLKQYLQPELNGPRINAGAGDPTHRCGHGNIRRRIAETWVIRHVEELGAELRGDPLADFRRLHNAHVEKLLPRTEQHIARAVAKPK